MAETLASDDVSETLSREEFLRGPGFVLYTDVNAKFLEATTAQSIQRVGGEIGGELATYVEASREGVNSANFGLWSVTRSLINHNRLINCSDKAFCDALGVTEEDMDAVAGKKLFASGFGDRKFPWHFSAGLAAAVVHRFVDEGEITDEQAGKLTLEDWATMIGSPWFSQLMHSLAFTNSGIYRSYGFHLGDICRDMFDQHIAHQLGLSYDHRHLSVAERADAESGEVHLIAELDPLSRDALRRRMRDGSRPSIGCPVARRSARLPRGFFETNPHVASLLEKDMISAYEEEGGDRMQIDQDDTAIGRTLSVIAWQLRRYDELYGTPVITIPRPVSALIEAEMSHEHLPATGVLVRSA